MCKSLRRQESCRQKTDRKGFGQRVLLSAAVVFFLAWFFYRSLWGVLPLAAVGLWCFRTLEKKEAKRKRSELAMQFRECILSVSTLLQAGYSAENAFLECRKDMCMLFGEEAVICAELKQLERGLHINIALEELLKEMAERSGCEEIMQFAGTFGLAKRNGGKMPEIIRNSAGLIGSRIELRRELDTLLSGKRMELAIMRSMPFGVLFYIEVSNPGYFDVMYHNLKGILVMTGCLLVYLTAFALGEKIMDRLWEELA